MSADAHDAAAHGEGRRALIASTLGIALGLVVALFMRREANGRRRVWRGRSAN